MEKFSSTESTKDYAEIIQKVKIPDGAQAYNINHGNYIFFKETPRDNPTKTAIILVMLIGGIGTSISIKSIIVPPAVGIDTL